MSERVLCFICFNSTFDSKITLRAKKALPPVVFDVVPYKKPQEMWVSFKENHRRKCFLALRVTISCMFY